MPTGLDSIEDGDRNDGKSEASWTGLMQVAVGSRACPRLTGTPTQLCPKIADFDRATAFCHGIMGLFY